MSVPVAFTPGVEVGSSLEGNLEIPEDDIVQLEFEEDEEFFLENKPCRVEVADFGDEAFLLNNLLSQKECCWFIKQGEELGFEKIIGVRDDYRDCKRLDYLPFGPFPSCL